MPRLVRWRTSPELVGQQSDECQRTVRRRVHSGRVASARATRRIGSHRRRAQSTVFFGGGTEILNSSSSEVSSISRFFLESSTSFQHRADILLHRQAAKIAFSGNQPMPSRAR